MYSSGNNAPTVIQSHYPGLAAGKNMGMTLIDNIHQFE